MKNNKKTNLIVMVYTALIIAVATVLNLITAFTGVGASMKISISAIFIKLPAVLFGPLYGGIAGAVADVLGYFIKPNGGYIFPMTVTAALGCAFVGYIWKYVKLQSGDKVRKTLAIVAISLVVFSFINNVAVTVFKGTGYANFISYSEKTEMFFVVWIDMIAICLGFILLIDYIIKRFFNRIYNENYIKLLVTLAVPNILVTTINTYILKAFIPALSKVAFWGLYIPRLIEEVIAIVVQALVISYMLKLYDKIHKN